MNRAPTTNAESADDLFTATVDFRITLAKSFAEQHREGSDDQISQSIDILLEKLNKGMHVTDAIAHAETAFDAIGRAEQARQPVVRHFDTRYPHNNYVHLDSKERAA